MMSDQDKSDSCSNEDDEDVVYKKYSQQREEFSDEDDEDDEDSTSSYEDEEDLEYDNRRQRRDIFEYDEEEDDFDFDDGSSSEEFHLDYDEEDEIMQVVVDEDGKTNVAIVDEYQDFDDDDDVVIPMEEQSLKTEAEIGSEIFESSPYIPPEEEDRSWKTSLMDVTQRYVRATLLLGKASQPEEERENFEPSLADSKEISASSPSLHVDQEILNITNTYMKVTRALGLSRRRSRSESILSRSSQSQSVGSRQESLSKKSGSVSVSKHEESPPVDLSRGSDNRKVGKALGNLGKKMVTITKRIGRSFSTNSLSISSGKKSEIS